MCDHVAARLFGGVAPAFRRAELLIIQVLLDRFPSRYVHRLCIPMTWYAKQERDYCDGRTVSHRATEVRTSFEVCLSSQPSNEGHARCTPAPVPRHAVIAIVRGPTADRSCPVAAETAHAQVEKTTGVARFSRAVVAPSIRLQQCQSPPCLRARGRPHRGHVCPKPGCTCVCHLVQLRFPCWWVVLTRKTPPGVHQSRQVPLGFDRLSSHSVASWTASLSSEVM